MKFNDAKSRYSSKIFTEHGSRSSRSPRENWRNFQDSVTCLDVAKYITSACVQVCDIFIRLRGCFAEMNTARRVKVSEEIVGNIIVLQLIQETNFNDSVQILPTYSILYMNKDFQ